MKSKMAVIIGCLALVGTFGGGHFLFQPVGSPVSQFEAGKVMGGACRDETAAYRVVCSSNCGTSTVNRRVSHSSGNSNAGIQCKSTAICTYDGVLAANCSAG